MLRNEHATARHNMLVAASNNASIEQSTPLMQQNTNIAPSAQQQQHPQHQQPLQSFQVGVCCC